MTSEEEELNALKESLRETQPAGVIINKCRTLDQVLPFILSSSTKANVMKTLRCTLHYFQAKAVLRFIDAISEKSNRSTVAMTAARGRGKSAALGLAMASAISFG